MADDLHDVRAQLLLINDAAEQLLTVYMDLYTALNRLYADFPKVYAEVQRTVRLPTNEDADGVTAFNRDLHAALQLLADEKFLTSVMSGGDLQTEVTEDQR